MGQHIDYLKQFKDFDENIAHEKQAKAREEQEKIKAKVSYFNFRRSWTVMTETCRITAIYQK